MPVSITDICNLALAEVGNKRIASIDDATNEARACKAVYAQTLDEALRSHPWNFAAARTILSELSPVPVFGWRHRFGLPPDFLRMIELNGCEGEGPTEQWAVEGGELLTNEEIAQVRYVARVADTGKFDPLFVKALSVLLASKIAANITGDRNLSASLLARYEGSDAPKARRIDASEASPRRRLPSTDSDLVRSRYQRFS